LTRWIATSGGKKRLATPAGFVAEPVETALVESPDPVVDELPPPADGPSGLGDRAAIGQEQDNPAAPLEAGGNGSGALPALKFAALLRSKADHETSLSSPGHDGLLRANAPIYLIEGAGQDRKSVV
jgi:hypothetical protein